MMPRTEGGAAGEYDLRARQNDKYAVWTVARHTGELTARRLVITVVPTTGWNLEDSRRSGAVTQVPSESSHRTRSIATMTAGSSGRVPHPAELNASATRSRF